MTNSVSKLEGIYEASEVAELIGNIQKCDDFSQDIFSTNISGEVPEGHTVELVTSSKRGVDGITSIVLISIPTVEELERVQPDFVKDTIQHTLKMKLVNALNRAEQPSAVRLPQSTTQFITGMRQRGSAGSQLDGFNAVWQILRDVLAAKTNGLFTLKKAEMRDALSNAAFAKANFDKLESAGIFVKLIELGKQQAEKDEELGETPEFDTWLQTRNEQVYEAIEFAEIEFEVNI